MTEAAKVRRIWIGEGGPLRHFESRCHLTTPFRQISVALLVTWVPLLVLGLVTELVTGFFVPLFHDPAVHVRLVIATPVLLYLDRIFPLTCRDVLEQLSHYGFIGPADQPRFDRTVARAARLGDWWLPETLIAIAAFGLGIAYLFGVMPATGFGRQLSRTLPAYWYALVALPVFEFLLFRSLWRWAIWVRLLVGLARVDLVLDATHPDRRGGISVLGRPSIAYCASLLFVASAVLSAEWVARFMFVSVGQFVPMLLAFAVVATLIAFGPLMLFSLQIHRARREAQLEVGGLAARAGRAFRQRWADCPGAEVIASQDIQSLAALSTTYCDTLKEIRVLPFKLVDIYIVLLATLLPVVPPMLVQIPHSEWLAMATLFLKGGL